MKNIDSQNRKYVKEICITIVRFDSKTDAVPWRRKYFIPKRKRGTVLDGLLYIRENIDHSLAFRYGCRFKRCGLCAVIINGKPKLACLSYIEDNMVIEPLKNVPVIRDLVIDKQFILQMIDYHKIYISGQGKALESKTFSEYEKHINLMRCNDCGCCISVCPVYGAINIGLNKGSPYLFVKLGQLLYNPEDCADRISQMLNASLWSCTECYACQKVCPQEVKITDLIIDFKKMAKRGENEV